MKNIVNSACAALLGIAVTVFPASAWAVTTAYIDEVASIWTSFVPNDSSVKLSANGARISWGKSKTGKRSGYTFREIVDDGPHALGTIFDLGQLTHRNFPITGSALKSVSLAITITGRLVDGLLWQDFSITSVFDVIHDETKNKQKNCPYGDKPPCGDLITFVTNAALSQTIVFNGVTYLFQASGFLGGLPGDSMFSDENRKNRAIMQGSLVALAEPPVVAPVPLPASLPLMAGALGFIGWMVRRKRA